MQNIMMTNINKMYAMNETNYNNIVNECKEILKCFLDDCMSCDAFEKMKYHIDVYNEIISKIDDYSFYCNNRFIAFDGDYSIEIIEIENNKINSLCYIDFELYKIEK